MTKNDPNIDRVINQRYRIEAKLGAGGYGAVYRAQDVETGERVALKVLHPVIANDRHIVTRFRREGRVLFRLRNPHTVLIHEFAYTADGIFYLAMELLQGKSLKQVVRKEAPVEWRRALSIVSQVCEALSEAHALNVIHRDLKPDNIYLTARPGHAEFVKILDFGIAKFLDGEGLGQDDITQLTGRGRTVGTIKYMSPEQLLGRELDGRSDIYTLGVVLYRLLTGSMPFPGEHTAGALVTAQLTRVPKAPSRMRSDIEIPELIDRLALQMLATEPSQRFQCIDDLCAACLAALQAGQWGIPAEEDDDATPALGIPTAVGSGEFDTANSAHQTQPGHGTGSASTEFGDVIFTEEPTADTEASDEEVLPAYRAKRRIVRDTVPDVGQTHEFSPEPQPPSRRRARDTIPGIGFGPGGLLSEHTGEKS